MINVSNLGQPLVPAGGHVANPPPFPCVLCGSSEDILWHHRDPATKTVNLSRPHLSRQVLQKELELCDPVCRSCHQRIHTSLPGEALALTALYVPWD